MCVCPGGQKLRWNDLLSRDLRQCGIEPDWQECALNRSELVKQGVRDINSRSDGKDEHASSITEWPLNRERNNRRLGVCVCVCLLLTE